jgi:tagatose-1,6-bisphosphate aldolase non-catalytic subunit AgaZ/GatZ
VPYDPELHRECVRPNFARRFTLYGLDLIASEMVADYGDRSLARTMERVMLAAPGHWHSYYHGSEKSLYLQRHYSYSDRIRYYWSNPTVGVAIGRLWEVLNGISIPETLVRQFLPALPVQLGQAGNPRAIPEETVSRILADYEAACHPDRA